MEYSLWEIQYKSCEGNFRWVIARAPIDWDKDEVRGRVKFGGSGDDVAEILDVFESNNDDYFWDFTDND